MELLLTGELINATQALQIGLVDEVVPLSRLMKRTVELAGMISGKAPVAVRFAKEAVNASSNLPLSEGLRLEGDLYLLLQTTRDRSEGVSAFLNKRKPMFHGD
jgi:enoyl-CoA hydratase